MDKTAELRLRLSFLGAVFQSSAHLLHSENPTVRALLTKNDQHDFVNILIYVLGMYGKLKKHVLLTVTRFLCIFVSLKSRK